MEDDRKGNMRTGTLLLTTAKKKKATFPNDHPQSLIRKLTSVTNITKKLWDGTNQTKHVVNISF